MDYFNFKSGGSYRYTHSDKGGNEMAAFNGAIHEANAPERIVQTRECVGLPERGYACLETMLFENLPGNRIKLTIRDVCQSVEDRDAMIACGMECGLNEGFNRLDDILKEL